MRIGIDIDDCLAVNLPLLIRKVNEQYKMNLQLSDLNGDTFRIEEYGLIRWDNIKKVLDVYEVEETFLQMEVHDGSVEAVNRISQKNDVYIITSRNNYPDVNKMKNHTEKWLQDNGFKYKELVLSQEKGLICKEKQINLFIDDYLGFAKQAASIGVDVILYAQPWNANYDAYMSEFAHNVLGRFNSWSEIANKILDLS